MTDAPWSDTEIETLKTMWRDKRSATETAAVLNRTRNAVIGKWHRLGLKDETRHGVALLDAGGGHCRFPLWDDHGALKSNRLIVCGKPGYPWCVKHRAIVFERRTSRLRRKFGDEDAA
jgi:hypothetical protein